MKKKSLTIVLFGRNDNYNGNYNYRLFTCLKFLEKSIIKNKLSKRVNINFIDWNSQKPFAEEKIFPKKILKNINLFTLSPKILKKLGFTERFNIQLCCNFGVRRSKDDYILYTNTDILITEYFLKNLFNFIDDYENHSLNLDKNALLIIPRKFIPPFVTESELSYNDLEKYIYYSSRFFKEAGKISGVCSGLGGILGQKKVWHSLQGFKENEMRGHGWNDVELGIMALKNGKLLDLDFFGLYLFDLQQSQILKKNINTNKYKLRKGKVSNWGISNLNIKPQKPSISYSEKNLNKIKNNLPGKIKFSEFLKALIISAVTNYKYVSMILEILIDKNVRIKNFFIKTEDFKEIEFLHRLSRGSFVNYFMSSKDSYIFGKDYLRFHYRNLKNVRHNIFKPYIDVRLNKKLYDNDLILFQDSIPNIFINIKPNMKCLSNLYKKNVFYYRTKNFKLSFLNFLIIAICLLNQINALMQSFYYKLKNYIKIFIT